MRIAYALIVFAASSSMAMAGQQMSGKDLTSLLGQGKTIQLGGKGMGYSGSLTLTADGKGKGEAKLDDGTIIPIEGTWHIKGNKFCRTWTGGDDANKEVCEAWIKKGKNAVTVRAGKNDIGVNSWD
jgi:hypothetical protein